MPQPDVEVLADIVAMAIKAAQEPLLARLAALEMMQAIKGETGAVGPQGVTGEKGDPGDRGAIGPEGPQGIKGDAGEPGPRGERGERGEDGPAGKDGIGITGALITEDGTLVLTYSDGTTKAAGRVTGAPGRDGLPGLTGPKGEDGANGTNGRDGVDGLGFDDLDVVQDTERTFSLRYARGERVKEFGKFTIPTVLDRGVFKDGTTYERGDGVTWGGSFFIAQKDTRSKPEESGGDWRLAVKRGREGREGKPGQQGPQGVRGEKGDRGPQ